MVLTAIGFPARSVRLMRQDGAVTVGKGLVLAMLLAFRCVDSTGPEISAVAGVWISRWPKASSPAFSFMLRR